MRAKISLMLSLLCLPFAFWACGDDGSSANSDSVVEKFDIMANKFEDLPTCSVKRDGDAAYVKDEKIVYICENGKWLADEENDDEESSSSVKSSSSSKKSSSSVAKDGASSSSSKKSSSSGSSSGNDGVRSSSSSAPTGKSASSSSVKSSSSSKKSSSSIAKDGASCSSSKKSSSSGSSSGNDGVRSSSSSAPTGKSASSSSVKSSSSSKKDNPKSSSSSKYEQKSSAYEIPAVVKDKSIAGVSQKGPFVTGSSVKLYELDEKNYAQTGKNFTGKVISDNGEFKVSDVSLASRYALLEVVGYFRNEVSGKKSNGSVTLNVLTDLSEREKVNINLLTHLEYKRALYLMGTGINVSAAKKQAEAEIFSAFGIMGDFANSEDLNIFSKGEGNAALLAFSVLMLGDRGDAELTELLTDFANDIEKDGEWNNESAKAKIADWAQERDLSGKLSSFRSNINSWNLGTAPNFEKYVRSFWYANYGLGSCDSGKKGAVVATTNERSKTYGTKTRYICKNESWVEASDMEKDTYQWNAGEDGEIKVGDVTESKNYVYDGAKNAWRSATAIEASLGGCTEHRESDFSLNTGKVNGSWYICKDREWKPTNNITVDTQGWAEGGDGDIKKGDSTDVKYKYDEALNQWVEANTNDIELNLKGCTTNRTGEISKNGETYYVCKNSNWQVTTEVYYDTHGEKCTSAEVGKTMNGKETLNRYYCSANGWVNLTDGWNWDVPKEARLNPEITYGSMVDSRDGRVYKTVTIGDGVNEQTWMAENLNYADSTRTISLKGKSWCYDYEKTNCEVTGRLYTWAAAIDSAALANDANNPQTCGYGVECSLSATVQGICPDGWHLPSQAEWNTLFTTVGGKSSAGTMLKSQTGWKSFSGESAGSDAYGFSALPAGYKNFDGGFDLVGYDVSFWSFSEQSSNSAYYMYLYSDYELAALYDGYKSYAFSVRCLKDSI